MRSLLLAQTPSVKADDRLWTEPAIVHIRVLLERYSARRTLIYAGTPLGGKVKMINVKSNHLVVVIATYNRLPQLKQALDFVISGTSSEHEVVVVDGGSDDGTVDYLKERSDVTPIFQGELVGTARAYNYAWRQIDSMYTCWLSDDTYIRPGSLDLAIDILDSEPTIGMVGLKMRDTSGPWKSQAYMGAISQLGILNCNHGVLRTDLLRSIGFFNEDYRSYMIDPDLTASVLSTGRAVVMTKEIAVLHDRVWADAGNIDAKIQRDTAGIDNHSIYEEKFRFLKSDLTDQNNDLLSKMVRKVIFYSASPASKRFGLYRRDIEILVRGRFTHIFDLLRNFNRSYHLVQTIPDKLLESPDNPYLDLISDHPRN